MAFNDANFTKLANLKTSTSDVPTPGLFYYETADNLAAMVTAGYFNGVRDLIVNGRIIGLASDGFRILKVTVPASGNVTVAAVLGAVS